MSDQESIERIRKSLEVFTHSMTGSGSGMTQEEIEEFIKRKNEEKVHIKIEEDVEYDIGVLHPNHHNTF